MSIKHSRPHFSSTHHRSSTTPILDTTSIRLPTNRCSKHLALRSTLPRRSVIRLRRASLLGTAAHRYPQTNLSRNPLIKHSWNSLSSPMMRELSSFGVKSRKRVHLEPLRRVVGRCRKSYCQPFSFLLFYRLQPPHSYTRIGLLTLFPAPSHLLITHASLPLPPPPSLSRRLVFLAHHQP